MTVEYTITFDETTWLYEDELPEHYPYEALFEHSRVIDGVRMFPETQWRCVRYRLIYDDNLTQGAEMGGGT